MSDIFYQIFIFDQMIAFKNYEKMFLFCLKSSFHSQDNQIFIFSSSPLFLPVSHCFKGYSKINLNVYDVINCLNKNLTHFVLFFSIEQLQFWQAKHGHNNKIKMDTKTRQKVTAILTLYCTKEGKAKNQLNNKICS